MEMFVLPSYGIEFIGRIVPIAFGFRTQSGSVLLEYCTHDNVFVCGIGRDELLDHSFHDWIIPSAHKWMLVRFDANHRFAHLLCQPVDLLGVERSHHFGHSRLLEPKKNAKHNKTTKTVAKCTSHTAVLHSQFAQFTPYKYISVWIGKNVFDDSKWCKNDAKYITMKLTNETTIDDSIFFLVFIAKR